ncbi:hypothetical protein HDEF_1794 [Candidatus Hamiltonella defensa 5AT (Acyrthosiphon pisum)]|uniref:Uncharacterized protein n=1 Tax=Hamiltonella defensa subsp. Acyrthosiphon pisum (strain 5AT) TaxID=572265 RepID=C4K747_HAMD5|nr:hypothetical protein HDEF_1794 [Candidatus Hamiltonella defensa 5AT (Acyrthosiphon pisum)]
MFDLNFLYNLSMVVSFLLINFIYYIMDDLFK